MDKDRAGGIDHKNLDATAEPPDENHDWTFPFKVPDRKTNKSVRVAAIRVKASPQALNQCRGLLRRMIRRRNDGNGFK